jgi:hypothetical protein
MTRRHVIFAIFLFLIGVVGFYYFRGGTTAGQLDVSESAEGSSKLPDHKTKVTSSPADGVYRTDLHSLADPEVRADYVKRAPESWDDWAKSLSEATVGENVQNGFLLTREAVESLLKDVYDQLSEQAALYKRKNHPLPEAIIPMPYLFDPKYYEGPQTPEALIAEFDQRYSSGYNEDYKTTMDEHYPRSEFLQRILDKGAVVKNTADYGYYLDLRGNLLWKKETPEEWFSGKYGIPITTNFAEYEEGFLERKIWENSILQQVSEADPGKSVTIYFSSKHPDKYLPVIGRMTYVRINENIGSIGTSGTTLTDEQRDDLLYRGIEPENIEIVYIDRDYNIVERPSPVDRETLMYKDVISIDGIRLTPENYEDVVGKPVSDAWLKIYEEREALEVSDPSMESDVNMDARREAAREAAAAAQETAKAEFEKFQNSMRQLEEFATLSDTEIEKQLEKQFRQQFLPKNPLEQLEQFTPERLENALGTLFQHGFEEGFRRVRRDSPALAEQLERFFGQGQKPPPEMQKKPQRPAPPKSPEAAPSEPEAP